MKKNEDIEEIPLEFDNQAIDSEPNYGNSTDKEETDDSAKQTMELIDGDKLIDKNELDKYNIVINESTSIRKSNELSTAKLIQGLTLSQTQLFSFAIYQTQKNGVASFTKSAFEKLFNIERYNSQRAEQDAEKLFLNMHIKFNTEDSSEYVHVFKRMKYNYKKGGGFEFEWEEEIKEHIFDLKSKFVLIDLKIASQFKSSYSWTLYETLKASFGRLTISFTKEEMMKLFDVEKKKSYVNNTSLFKQYVLDVAINDVNNLTEFDVSYEDIRRGRSIIGFKINFYRYPTQNGKTEKQMEYLMDIIQDIQQHLLVQLLNIRDDTLREQAGLVAQRVIAMTDNLPSTSSEFYEAIKKANEGRSYITNAIEKEKERLKERLKESKYDHFEIPIYDFKADKQ